MLTPAKDLVRQATYRAANEKDLPWINEQFSSLKLAPANLEKDKILIAESMGRPIGVCRGHDVFVLEAFRNLGVEERLIAK